MKTLQILEKAIEDNLFTEWSPRPDFLILVPSRLPKTKGGIVLPESYTKKTMQGICIKACSDVDQELFLAAECFFPMNVEYQVKDTVSNYYLYIVAVNQIILTRIPDKDTIEASIVLPESDLKFHTLEQTQAVS